VASVREIKVQPVTSAAAEQCVKRWHYSGRVVQNSQVHLGATVAGRLLGVMSFGPPMDRRKVIGLVSETPWDGMIELNRMAFSDELPRNSESRCLSVACRMLAQRYANLQWILSFADGVQCGDGTIYRAAGWLLTGIGDSSQILEAPDGVRFAAKILTTAGSARRVAALRSIGMAHHPLALGSSLRPLLDGGFRVVPGFMLRYVKPLRAGVRDRLTVPVMPYSAIEQRGATMYRSQRPSSMNHAPPDHGGDGGVDPTDGLQHTEVDDGATN
jgi:hypothetical protein